MAITYTQAVEIMVAMEQSENPAHRCRARSLYLRLRSLVPDAPSGDDYRALLEVDAWIGELLVDMLEETKIALSRIIRGDVLAEPARRIDAAELLGRIHCDFPDLPESDHVVALWEARAFLAAEVPA